MLAEHEAVGQLMRFKPLLDPDECEARTLFVVPEIHFWLYQDHPQKALTFAANVRGFLKRFVIGDFIDNRDYMKSESSNVFRLRVQNQRKGERVRIFGCFAKSDIFVALFQKPREVFDSHSERWAKFDAEAISVWNHYFSPRPTVPAIPFSNCVTSNAYDYDTGDEI
jgi:hypothetical protein